MWRDLEVILIGNQCLRGGNKIHTFIKITEQKSRLHMNRCSVSAILFSIHL